MNTNGITETVSSFLYINLANILLIIFFLATTITSIYFYRSKTLHLNHKFTVYIKLLSSFGAIALASTLFLTVMYRKQDSNETSFQTFNQLFGQFAAHMDLFINHPEMNYYYNDIYGKRYMNYVVPYKRNRILEMQISTKILNTIASFLDYFKINKNYSTENILIMKERQDKLLDLHMKSKMFRENWEVYKTTIAAPLIIDYMKEKYNA